MNILIIADPYVPVPPVKYGGSERVIDLLCRGLQKQGHTINLIGAQGSNTYNGKLITHPPPGPNFWNKLYCKFNFQAIALKALKDIDVVINHGKIDYLELIARTSTPLICQFHNAINQSDIDFILKRRKSKRNIRFVGVSHSHIRHAKPPELFSVIYNGIDTDYFTPNITNKKKYLAFLGRIDPHKGLDLAITVAKSSGIPLKIGGNIPNNRYAIEYFEKSIKPLLDHNCEWIGPVNDQEKRELLSGAIATLFPIQWDEPFGLVMIESLACGTPVIAQRRASTPEVITDGETGFLCESVEEMVSAINKIERIDRRVCRHAVESHFSAELMVEKNLDIINQIIQP